ncbi:hypothetical protein [Vibrio harveyi]|uniref:hypothetical protein n=1 Tax=Vibrio harveyi TaxID=669 RepID=UPI003CE70B2B
MTISNIEYAKLTEMKEKLAQLHLATAIYINNPVQFKEKTEDEIHEYMRKVNGAISHLAEMVEMLQQGTYEESPKPEMIH